MNTIKIVGIDANSTSTFTLKKEHVADVHIQSLFDAVNVENQNRRVAHAHTKTKAEVSGTGKKPYKQKHTGRARQGSRRNPQFVGGGCAFGPKNLKNYHIKMNKKCAALAYSSAWSHIFASGKISILDKAFFASVEKPKTALMSKFIKDMQLEGKKVLLILDKTEKILNLSARNMENLIVKSSHNVSVRDLLNQSYVLISNQSWALLEQRLV